MLHSLRHSYICHLLLDKVAIRIVQLYAVLRPHRITTTEKYAYQALQQAPDAAMRMAI